MAVGNSGRREYVEVTLRGHSGLAGIRLAFRAGRLLLKEFSHCSSVLRAGEWTKIARPVFDLE
jgi:hypothetical protein